MHEGREHRVSASPSASRLTVLGLLAAAVGRLRQARSGATAVEYGLIAAIIAAALVAGLIPLGNGIKVTFQTTSATLDNSGD